MLVTSLFGSISRSYLTGIFSGKALIQSATKGRVGDYNTLQLLQNGGYKASFEVTDFVALEKKLREFGPQAQADFRKQAKKIGEDAKKDVRKGFKAIGARGPLGPRKDNKAKPWATPERNRARRFDGFNTEIGRLKWANAYAAINRNSGIDVQYKSRKDNKAFNEIKKSKDGTISVVRIRVRKGPLIIADMAGRKPNSKSMYGKRSYRSVTYNINLFGRGQVSRYHRINPDNSDKFVENLSNARGKLKPGASRYAWPGAEKHMPKFRVNAQSIIDQTVAEINRRLEAK